MKKKLLLGLSLIGVVAAASVGTTLAVLSHETTTAKNTMTVGRAQIEQLEYQRVVDENGNWVSTGEEDQYGFTPDKLEPFKNNQIIIPTTGDAAWDTRDNGTHQQSYGQIGASGSDQLFDKSVTNVIDKMVFVKNTGNVDVYYRTIIAFEAPEGAEGTLKSITTSSKNFDWNQVKDGVQYASDLLKDETEEFIATINNERYAVKVLTYQKALTPNTVSRPSLLQVYMRKEVTNEMIAKFGPEVDILVFSQAVQSKGYTNAKTALVEGFGEISENNHPWLTATFNRITTLSGEVNLTEDLWLVDEPFYNETVTGPLTINGNGHIVNQTVTDSELMTWPDGTTPAMGTMFASKNGELVTVNDLTFNGTNQIISLGKYTDYKSDYFNTELNNVNVIGLQVAPHISMGIAPAVAVYGTATLNNTTITGTMRSERELLGHPIYDLALTNYSNTTLNNSTIGTIYMWNKEAKLTVNAGSIIDTLYLIHTDKGINNPADIVVNEGGKINNVVTRTGTYTYEEWLASVGV